MILADTSVWINHFRSADPLLAELLEEGQILSHPFVIGELACGHLRPREEALSLLRALPAVVRAEDEEVLSLIEEHRLMGSGLGLIDIHLLASCLMEPCQLWTADQQLRTTAASLEIVFDRPARPARR